MSTDHCCPRHRRITGSDATFVDISVAIVVDAVTLAGSEQRLERCLQFVEALDRFRQRVRGGGQERVELGAQVEEEPDHRPSFVTRRTVAAAHERVVHESFRGVERNAGRAVVAHVTIDEQGLVGVVVVARSCRPDVSLDEQMSQCDRRHVGVGEDLADTGEDSFRQFVDERVGPAVTRRVREEAVREGEDLQLLGLGVGRCAGRTGTRRLRCPCPIEQERQPTSRVFGMNDRLTHREVGEAVRPDHTRVVVRRVVAQGRDHSWRDRVLDRADRDHAVVDRVRVGVEAGLIVGERFERVGRCTDDRRRRQHGQCQANADQLPRRSDQHGLPHLRAGG